MALLRSRSLALECGLLAAVLAGHAAEFADAARISVCVRNDSVVPLDNLDEAEFRASAILNRANVSIQWRCRDVSGEPVARRISIEILPRLDESGMRAIAYAMPFEGTHVRVFYDRIAHMPNRSAVLAYVFVHELTHMLQGIARHSATGIMKARWTTSDIDKMGCQHLAFTPLDIDLIQRGLAAGSRAEDKPAGEASEDSRFSAASTLSFRAP